MPSCPDSTKFVRRFLTSEKYPGEDFGQFGVTVWAISEVFLGSALSAETTSTQSSACRW